MPLIDMPLEELHRYNGRNPRPDDFDAYWERALADMRAVDAQVELVPSAFQAPRAECFDLYFTGVRGARLHAKYVRPKSAPQPHPAVVMFHGYSVHSGDWADKLAYASLGFSVLALDCRGQGGLSEDVGGVKGTTIAATSFAGLTITRITCCFAIFFWMRRSWPALRWRCRKSIPRASMRPAVRKAGRSRSLARRWNRV